MPTSTASSTPSRSRPTRRDRSPSTWSCARTPSSAPPTPSPTPPPSCPSQPPTLVASPNPVLGGTSVTLTGTNFTKPQVTLTYYAGTTVNRTWTVAVSSSCGISTSTTTALVVL